MKMIIEETPEELKKKFEEFSLRIVAEKSSWC